jgi:predicted nucleotide-binding protein (sugar kinase/HSP70/actin superfamily)
MTDARASDQRTIYIPYMSDHVHVLAAALQALGVPAEVLPPPDEETVAIALEFCKGRECLPCLLTTGDLIRRARQPGFDRQRAAFLMPSGTGTCRFGYFHVLQQEILARLGYGDVEIIAPDSADRYRVQMLGGNWIGLVHLCWQGLVAVDLLQKLVHEYRPYELVPGQTDRLYPPCLERIIAAVRRGAGRPLRDAMHWIADQFAALPVDRRQRRPRIGLVGEFYIRFNPFSNDTIIRRVEAAGGEVVLASMMELFYFNNGWDYRTYNRPPLEPRALITSFLTNAIERHEERRLSKPVASLLTDPHETPIGTLLQHLRPYFNPTLSSEAILSMGKAIELAHQGMSGIIHIMPFSCLPGIITAGMAPRLRADLDGLPWLDVICDAQGGTNIQTRLEAFMYQTVQFQRRRAAAAASAAPSGAR